MVGVADLKIEMFKSTTEFTYSKGSFKKAFSFSKVFSFLFGAPWKQNWLYSNDLSFIEFKLSRIRYQIKVIGMLHINTQIGWRQHCLKAAHLKLVWPWLFGDFPHSLSKKIGTYTMKFTNKQGKTVRNCASNSRLQQYRIRLTKRAFFSCYLGI